MVKNHQYVNNEKIYVLWWEEGRCKRKSSKEEEKKKCLKGRTNNFLNEVEKLQGSQKLFTGVEKYKKKKSNKVYEFVHGFFSFFFLHVINISHADK